MTDSSAFGAWLFPLSLAENNHPSGPAEGLPPPESTPWSPQATAFPSSGAQNVYSLPHSLGPQH